MWRLTCHIHGYDPAAKAAFHCLGLYEISTVLQTGNATMVLNIPQGIHISRKTNFTCEAAEWRAMYPMPSITLVSERCPSRPKIPRSGRTVPSRPVAPRRSRADPHRPVMPSHRAYFPVVPVISSHKAQSPAIPAPIPTCDRRQGALGNEDSNKTTTQHGPLPRGHHDISPAATLDPAPDLTSAFTNSPETGVAEIETSVLGRDSAKSVPDVHIHRVSNRAGSRASKRTSHHVVSVGSYIHIFLKAPTEPLSCLSSTRGWNPLGSC